MPNHIRESAVQINQLRQIVPPCMQCISNCNVSGILVQHLVYLHRAIFVEQQTPRVAPMLCMRATVVQHSVCVVHRLFQAV